MAEFTNELKFNLTSPSVWNCYNDMADLVANLVHEIRFRQQYRPHLLLGLDCFAAQIWLIRSHIYVAVEASSVLVKRRHFRAFLLWRRHNSSHLSKCGGGGHLFERGGIRTSSTYSKCRGFISSLQARTPPSAACNERLKCYLWRRRRCVTLIALLCIKGAFVSSPFEYFFLYE